MVLFRRCFLECKSRKERVERCWLVGDYLL